MGNSTFFKRSRLANFKGGFKKLLGYLTPRDRQKFVYNDDDLTSYTSTISSMHDAMTVDDDIFLEGFIISPAGSVPTSNPPPSDNLDVYTTPQTPYSLPSPPLRHSTALTEDDVESVSSITSTDTFGNPRDDTFLMELSDQSPSCRATPVQPYVHDPNDDHTREGRLREAPTILQAQEALVDLNLMLRGPSKGKGGGYKKPSYDVFVEKRLYGMQILLSLYTNPKSATYDRWSASSLQAAVTMTRGIYCSRMLRKLCRAYIRDRTILPVNPYGDWNDSILVDEDLCNDINLFLQEIGDKITAEKLVEYLSQSEVMDRHGITKKISIWTARRYLKTLGYRFKNPSKGQYSDGHERDDVVKYRNHFLSRIREFEPRIRTYIDGLPVEGPFLTPGKAIILWYHDESIFYANDRRRKSWYHKDAPAKPYKKGEGASLMIADYVSAEFGWLRSKDGSQSARRVMKPGKNRDGYFTNDEILEQANEAMDIVEAEYSDFEHVFIYDNAPTHLKRAEGAISARYMTKNPSARFFVQVTERDENGKPMYNPDGTLKKVEIRMSDAEFDGHPQPLYFPEGHPHAGMFKGISEILRERGMVPEAKLNLECKGFKCPPPALACCARRVLFNQPDFTNQPTLLDTVFAARGFQVIFLPKFHCELNPIEQCWGYAKRVYRLNPESSREEQLVKYSLDALDSVPLLSMRRFASRSRKFMLAYSLGLNGRQAAWAARKYRGHRVIPETILAELDEADIQ